MCTSKILFLFSNLILTLFILPAEAQVETIELSMEQCISFAIVGSTDSKIAITQKHRSDWQYRSYLAETRPGVILEATLPAYNNIITNVLQNDGTYKYLPQTNMELYTGLAVSQNIGLTGGKVFLRSDLYRFDLLGDSSKTTSYLSSPLYIGINQPLFGFNQYKWKKKIEPALYYESQLQYVENLEEIRVKTVGLFFNALTIQQQLLNLELNSLNNDTLYGIGKERFRIGAISETELMQLELQSLKANNELESRKITLKNQLRQLQVYLKMDNSVKLQLIIPDITPFVQINEAIALSEAWKNRPEPLAFNRRVIESKMKLDQAKKERGLNMNLYATYGITQDAAVLSDAFKNFDNQKIATLGLSLPILDWGEAKGRIKMAQSELDLENEKIEQEKNAFDQQIRQKVDEFNEQQLQLGLLKKSVQIANKSYYLIKQRYLSSQISLLELFTAQSDKDQAELALIDGIRNYWLLYYEIRQFTLYDFVKNSKIEYSASVY